MIITRTPFRVTLGGGGTDLPSYYSKYGGFIFSFTLNKYMYINVNRPVADNFIRVKYSSSEKVAKIENLKHDIARACLQKLDITNNIEISSMSDIPAGSGLGSSSSYTVGLLNALHALRRDYISLYDLAEEHYVALTSPNLKYEIFNAGSGTISGLSDVKNILAKKGDINKIHVDVSKTGSKKFPFDMNKAANKLNFKPKYTLENGVEDLIKWYSNRL